ncbi:ictacalcin-like [Tachysurus vachellii]|uniref:ictacalcin-like n=1 Tax=Tachysurus vachellii TaxID=175792 RepID=UPI00296AEECB|nr:ictacalcin-like [Tachysurus vachellii]
MSQLQQGMGMLIATFHKYSGKEGDKLTLSKGELKDLLNAEMGDILGKTQDKVALDKILKNLDANQDGTVDFQEYITLVTGITMMCNEYFTKNHNNQNNAKHTPIVFVYFFVPSINRKKCLPSYNDKCMKQIIV